MRPLAFILVLSVLLVRCGAEAPQVTESELDQSSYYQTGTYERTTEEVYLYPVKVNGLYGYVDTLGRMVIEPAYQEAGHFGNGLAPVSQDGLKFGYIDYTGYLVLPFGFDMAGEFHEGLATATTDLNNFGYIDTLGQWRIQPQFERAEEFIGGRAFVLFDGRFGQIDTSGNRRIACEYDLITKAKDDYYEVFSDDKMGVLREDGSVVVPCEYDVASLFFENFVSVTIDNYEGLFQLASGKMILPAEYDGIFPFKEFELIIASKDTVEYVLDFKGRKLIQGANRIKYLNHDVIVAETQYEYHLYSTSGKRLTAAPYDFIGAFAEGLAPACKDGMCGYINEKGALVIPMKFKGTALRFEGGLAPVEHQGSFGFIDETGEWVVPPQYVRAEPFSEGFAAVKTQNGYGFINAQGNEVIAPQFEDAYAFNESGFAVVENQAGKMGLIDRAGTVVINMQYDDIEEVPFDSTLYFIKSNGLNGVANIKNEVIIAPTFSQVEYKDGMWLLNQKGYKGLATAAGTVVLQPEWAFVEHQSGPVYQFIKMKEENKGAYEVGYVLRSGEIIWPIPGKIKPTVHTNDAVSTLTQ